MKKALILAVTLAAVAAANADLRIFFTSNIDDPNYGVADPAKSFLVTGGTGEDGGTKYPTGEYIEEDDGTLTPIYGPIVPGNWALKNNSAPTYRADYVPQINEPGEFVYVWGSFTGSSSSGQNLTTGYNFDPNGNPLDPNTGARFASNYTPNGGILFSASMHSTDSTAQFAWYAYDNSYANGINLKPRWDNNTGEMSGAIGALAAVEGTGVMNDSGALNVPELGRKGRVFLLGAIKPQQTTERDETLTPIMDSFGLPAFAYGISTVNGGKGFPIAPIFGKYHVLPEPASFLLLGLAGLLIRRR